jgi:uncharacterized membrane protein
MNRHKTATASTTTGKLFRHPLAHDVNAEHREQLSPIERACKCIADWTGAPMALVLAISVQFVWIVMGIITKWDPFPFAFLLTMSNILQLILIFVLAIGQRQSFQHSELRAEHDHDAISRLFYHQEVQEEFLIRVAQKLELDIADLKTTIVQLSGQDSVT